MSWWPYLGGGGVAWCVAPTHYCRSSNAGCACFVDVLRSSSKTARLQRARERILGKVKSYRETKEEPSHLHAVPCLGDCQRVGLSKLACFFCFFFLFFFFFYFSFSLFPHFLPSFLPSSKITQWNCPRSSEQRRPRENSHRTYIFKKEGGHGAETLSVGVDLLTSHGLGVQVHNQAKLKKIFPLCKQLHSGFASISKGTMKERQTRRGKHGQWKNLEYKPRTPLW